MNPAPRTVFRPLFKRKIKGLLLDIIWNINYNILNGVIHLFEQNNVSAIHQKV